MAKHVSTIPSDRAIESAKTYPKGARGAFEALDGIECALIDLQSTADTFRALVNATIESVSTETDTMLRHVESDVAQLRAAFNTAFKSILGAPKGGAA